VPRWVAITPWNASTSTPRRELQGSSATALDFLLFFAVESPIVVCYGRNGFEWHHLRITSNTLTS
jgi:hypothetical protein